MKSFKEIGLKSEILASIEALGFETPTPIQQKSIPFILESELDLIAMAQTGTGKTAAFGLPVLHKLEEDIKNVQAIVLCPTRELCLQITKDLKSYSTNLDFAVVPVYGGASINDQIRAIQRKCEIVVGTPGRVNDMVQRGKLDLSEIKYLVLDEADEMLKMGFKEEMDSILDQTPETKQTLLFSATMPQDMKVMAKKYMHSPQTISVSKENVSNLDISHEFCVTTPSNLYQALRRVADMTPDIYGIIFCRTRQETKDIADKLMEDGYNADALHGDLSQDQRDYVMGRFRNKHLQLLVATDVAARGLDVDNLSHVIHYHFPDDVENYIHRSGRTGRAGKKGISIAILTTAEQKRVHFFEKQTGQKMKKSLIPSGSEVFKKRLETYIKRISQTEEKKFDIEELDQLIAENLSHLSKEELIDKLLTFEFEKLHSHYKNAQDLNSQAGLRSERGDRRNGRDRDGRDGRNGRGRDGREGRGARERRSSGSANFGRFSINIGSKNNLRPDVLISIINRQTPDHKIAIGRINIQQDQAIFEADRNHEDNLIKAFRRARYKGIPISVQAMNGEPNERSRRERSKKSRRTTYK